MYCHRTAKNQAVGLALNGCMVILEVGLMDQKLRRKTAVMSILSVSKEPLYEINVMRWINRVRTKCSMKPSLCAPVQDEELLKVKRGRCSLFNKNHVKQWEQASLDYRFSGTMLD